MGTKEKLDNTVKELAKTNNKVCLGSHCLVLYFQFSAAGSGSGKVKDTRPRIRAVVQETAICQTFLVLFLAFQIYIIKKQILTLELKKNLIHGYITPIDL